MYVHLNYMEKSEFPILLWRFIFMVQYEFRRHESTVHAFSVQAVRPFHSSPTLSQVFIMFIKCQRILHLSSPFDLKIRCKNNRWDSTPPPHVLVREREEKVRGEIRKF